eukprot:m.7627 g.7627  ORF g.7627 m.7627 type:complete len:469 (+) comp2459_c0_seq2:165-1571(+)
MSAANGSVQRRRSGEGAAGKQRASLGGRAGLEGLLVQRSYKNTLPDIPQVPKFLSLPFLDSSRFVEYQHTSLEKAHKSEIHVGKDLGIPVELIDPTVYEGGENLQMHPHDEELLRDPSQTKAAEATEDSVPWLRSTTYISTDNRSYGRDAQDWSENKIMGGHVVADDIEEYQSREAQIKAIEATFDAATQSKLVHPVNPNLTPVEVTPILPSQDYWGRPFLHGVFDNDPTTSLKLMEKQSVTARRSYLAQGMLAQRQEEGSTLAEFSLFLPQPDTYQKRRAVQAGEADDIAPGETYTFDKARDYVLELKDNEGDDTYVLATHNGKTVYKSFQGRVKLNRRRERSGRRTGKVTLAVSHRLPTDEELLAEHDQLLPLFFTELEPAGQGAADTTEGDGDAGQEAGAAAGQDHADTNDQNDDGDAMDEDTNPDISATPTATTPANEDANHDSAGAAGASGSSSGGASSDDEG